MLSTVVDVIGDLFGMFFMLVNQVRATLSR